MKQNISRFLSIVLVVALSVFLCVPAFAASDSAYEQKVGFWDWIAGKGSILNGFVGNTLGKVCAKSEDGYHHANSYQKDYGNGYYKCICSYCGKEFRAYESDLNQSYQQQVSTLPATGYSSDGSLLYSLSHKYFDIYNYTGDQVDLTCEHGSHSYDSYRYLVFNFDCVSNSVELLPVSGSTGFNATSVTFCYSGMAPVSGYYSLISGPAFSGYWIDSGGVKHFSTKSYSSASSVFYSAGDSFSTTIEESSFFLYSSATRYAFLQGIFPVYKVTPIVAISGDTYNINTRPTTITGGNYGIVGDDNNITTVTNTTQIVNEGDNLYYNPATGQTQTITDWTYNYDGRIYNITLDTGDKVSVEYGDENITITENNVVEGDTIVNNYTIYYMIDGSGSGESHTHEWYKTGERQATCLVPAQRTYTCSICGEQKTETDPVLGHSWHAIQTVTTQYDDDGNQTQEGYTIYECERCGEQYKSTNNTGPPPTGGGGSGGGTSENIFTGIFGLIWDFFTFLFDLFSEFVVGGIKGFIDGLKDAGSSFFSILSPFDWGY